MSAQSRGGRLVSRAEIAELAGVRPSAVTNWERRHGSFPQELREGGRELFRLADIVRWLDVRRVPSPSRDPAEPADITFGDRVRASLGQYEGASTPGQAPQLAIPARNSEQERSRSRQALSDLLQREMQEAWGARSPAAYLSLLMCLTFLRWGAEEEWVALKELAEGHPSVIPKSFIDDVGRRTGQSMQKSGVASAGWPALQGLEPGPAADAPRLLALVAELGREAFRDLLDSFANVVAVGSRDAFTPTAVVTLLSELVATEGVSGRISDPYPRGGELLAAMVAASGDAEALTVSMGVTNPSMARMAAMNLMLHGVSPQLEGHGGALQPADRRLQQPGANFVLTNPPFNADTGRIDSGNWRYGNPPASNDNFAWLQHVLSTLGAGGRAGVIMADNAAVSDQPRERAIRRAMVEDGVVECVLALPPQLFRGTAVSACAWFLTTPSDRAEVHFINARELGEMVSRTRRQLSPDDVRLLGEIHRSLRDGTALPDDARRIGRSVAVEEIKERGHSLSPVDYVSVGTYVEATPEGTEAARRELDLAQGDAVTRDEEVRSLWGRAEALGYGENCRPGEWRSVLLGELCSVTAGPSPSLLNPKMYSETGDVPVLLPKHLRNRRLHGGEDSKVSERVALRLERFRVSEGDILCSRTGTVGPVALVGSEEGGHLYSGNLLRLHDFKSGVDSRFVLAHLSLPEVQAWIKDRAAMTTVDSIKTSAMKQVPVSLPPLEVQRRIGDLLHTLDRQIEAHHRVASAAEAAREELAMLLVGGVASGNTRRPAPRGSCNFDRSTAKEIAGE
ncbi:N-6 DNA methylase [Kitasatospora sp. NPDC088160]|uniref:N-6 DNA methylase n=1 Tax=Kitasatospora sp. NPDC088160 TaxID=3364072 RepID=UPI00380AC23D